GNGVAREARGFGAGGSRLLAVSRPRRGSDGRLGRRRHHAAEEHLVRTEAAGRPADTRHLAGARLSRTARTLTTKSPRTRSFTKRFLRFVPVFVLFVSSWFDSSLSFDVRPR